jgi:hypothetical protein
VAARNRSVSARALIALWWFSLCVTGRSPRWAAAARSTFWPLMICRAAPAALVAAVDRVRWAASAGGSACLGLPIGSPQLTKLADYAAKLVVRGGVEPPAFRFSGAFAAWLHVAGCGLMGDLAAESMAGCRLVWPGVCRRWLPPFGSPISLTPPTFNRSGRVILTTRGGRILVDRPAVSLFSRFARRCRPAHTDTSARSRRSGGPGPGRAGS